MTLAPGQYALDDLVMGAGTTVGVKSVDRGDRVVYSQDVDTGGEYGVTMGRDRDGSPEWSMDLLGRGTEAEARAALRALSAAWHHGYEPGQTSVLRWAEGGVVRRVVGRARRFRDFAHPHILAAGFAPVLATFQLADPRTFDDVAQQVTLSIVPATVGGLEAPLVAPLSTVRSSEPRAGHVTSHGLAPAPVTVTFAGPVTDPWVRGDGWEVGVTGALAYDQSVTVDALAGTAVRQDGASVAGRLTRATRLRDAALAPGQQEITFGGSDSTGTATATITWRDAWWSI